jgi:hypothetical protein
MTNEHVTVGASKQTISSIIVAFMALLLLPMGRGEEKGPLQLRLIVPEPNICLGTDRLRMDAVFSNNSDLPISVYETSIYSFLFTKTILRGNRVRVESYEERKNVGTGDLADHETTIVLNPHISIVVPIEHALSDPFFREPATYSVRARYMKIATSSSPANAASGDFTSNEVLFELNECR